MRTPDLLAVLRDAGVVDAGGYGAGRDLRRASWPRCAATSRPSCATTRPARVTHPQHDSTTFRYCTNFAVTGAGLEPRRDHRRARRARRLGAGRRRRAHAQDPRPHRSARRRRSPLVADAGEVSHLDVADMHEQVGARERRLAEGARCGVLAVVASAGIGDAVPQPRRARARRRPDAEPVDLRAARRRSTRSPPRRSSSCPTAPNVSWPPSAPPSCRRSRSSSSRRAASRPRSPRSSPTPRRGSARRERRGDRRGARARPQPARSRPAARDDADGRFSVGEAVGFVDESLVAWGEPEPTLAQVLGRARRRQRADHLHRRRRRAAERRADRRARARRRSSSSTATAASRATGGCCPPSSGRARRLGVCGSSSSRR